MMNINETEYVSDHSRGDFIYRVNGTAEWRNMTDLFL